jgi:hypothetical protein
VIEKSEIAVFHFVSHHISGLIISNAIPVRRLVCLEVVDAEGVRFGFEKPVVHVLLL